MLGEWFLATIIDLQLNDLRLNLDKKSNVLKISKTAKENLIRNGIHREWGARPMRRMIQNEIENAISARFLSGEFKENGVITIKSINKELIFEQKSNSKTKKAKSRKKTKKVLKTEKSIQN